LNGEIVVQIDSLLHQESLSISRSCLDAKKGLEYYVQFCCVDDAEIMQGESENIIIGNKCTVSGSNEQTPTGLDMK
jgi:hypothetical protein